MADAAVLPRLPGRAKSLTTGERNQLDEPPAHSRPHRFVLILRGIVKSRQRLSATEREFYLRMNIRERWSKRELERQLYTRILVNSATALRALRAGYADRQN